MLQTVCRMTSGWLHATVKDVVGADTLIVVAASKNANVPPPEKRITLSSLIAPRLVRRQLHLESIKVIAVGRDSDHPDAAQGRRDGTTEDEPFAYAARDYLRRRAIGKVR